MKTTRHFSMENQTLIHVDLLAMNVSWTPKDLELFEIEFDLLVSTICTIARFITFVTAIVVHRAFYRLMKRLPGRAVNQVIYPYMVSKSITILLIIQRCSMVKQTIWPPNHTSHTKKYINEIVANALRDNIGIVNFGLRCYGGC